MDTFKNNIMLMCVWFALLSYSSTLAVITQPMDCLEGNKHCYSDTDCKRKMTILSDVCDRKDDYCRNDTGNECGTLLTSLQNSAFFHRCTCHPQGSEDLVLCERVHRRVYEHPCSIKDYYYRDDYEDDKADADDTDSEDDERPDGCTRVRKRCIGDKACDKALRTYRIKCTESKRQNRCTTLDKEGCFAAIQQMETLIPDLFTCGCEQRDLDKRTRCQRIQSRLAKNTCRIEVPYFIHSRQPEETTFETLVSIVEETYTAASKPKEKEFPGISIVDKSTCPRAFKECKQDSSCHREMANFMSVCEWKTCNRQACLDGIKQFFFYIRARHAKNLLFCQCKKGDEPCEKVKRALYPTCSLIQTPAPSCLDIMAQCKADTDCSMKYEAYEVNCGFLRGDALCPGGPSMCRSAMLAIMGTILMTNCTCLMEDPEERELCIDTRRRFQGYSDCKRDAIEHFHMGSDPDVTQVNDDSTFTHKEDCMTKFGENFPSYYQTPVTIRKYDNNSTCSELCTCLHNGTLLCRVLPCRLGLSCHQNGHQYSHGTEFSHSEHSHCRCIRGETVCSIPRATSAAITIPGLFLHLGISIIEKNLIEENSDVTIDKNSLTRKLSTILNSDSAEQYCSLNLYQATEKHLVLKVDVSPYNQKKNGMESCVSNAKKVAYRVNGRHPTIVKDPELSVIKVAQLQNVTERGNTHHTDTMKPIVEDIGLPFTFQFTPAGQATFNTSQNCLPCQMLLWCLIITVSLYRRLWYQLDWFPKLDTCIYNTKTCSYG